MTPKPLRWLIVVAALLLSACAGGIRPDVAGPAVIAVTGDMTVQEAVDAAEPGDTIEIGPGTYPESVTVSTPDLVIRGTDRNTVILDGGGLRTSGIVVTAPRVVVENITVHDYTLYGVLVTGMSDESGGLARGSDGYQRLDPDEHPPLEGFVIRHVTSTNNGLYGIYAFDAHHGLIAGNYASGSSDSGIYVGQCQQCDILVRDNVAFGNAVGYEQANASDSVVVVNNRFTGNRIGMTMLSNYQEALVPLRGAVIAGNVVDANHNPTTPSHAEGGFGVGIGISGGQAVEVRNNLIADHPRAGVELNSEEDLAPQDNQLIDNTWVDNAYDVVDTSSERAPGSGNCVSGPVGATVPKTLAADWSCPDGGAETPGGDGPQIEVPSGMSYRDVPQPPAQPNVPVHEPVDFDTVTEVDLDAVTTPEPGLFDDRLAGGQ